MTLNCRIFIAGGLAFALHAVGSATPAHAQARTPPPVGNPQGKIVLIPGTVIEDLAVEAPLPYHVMALSLRWRI